ncbi:hypothetical protein PGT21_036804 [Puccinia graminis f. sp. tritici]|uniref:Uncharacterized protein n=1 Tax=Puccinia graminis f. sp. tritici TaxID=56615 RepID=A0A5B0P1H2_PUCGR|nr:hypothetical protein PGT21_036804 [Puccinia graminis f. sp. tritici]KAA1121508.1 hypothetical protein PGTUg99_030155 [Puccinia graminis f. sp. tritici]
MGDGFSSYCMRRIRQYGLPFVGLSISLDDPKALEWNRRTAAFCADTFYQAAEASEHLSFFRSGYDLNGVSPERVATLIQKNFEYRIAEMTKDAKRAKGKGRMTSHPPHSGSSSDSSEDGKLHARKLREADEQQDRRYARRVALSQRRYETVMIVPQLQQYQDLFLDERLCSSDESAAEDDDTTRIRHAPVWRSQRATALVEEIDESTRDLRRKGPKKSGRKPAKRISLGARGPRGGSGVSPCNLPGDCYDQFWLQSQDAKAKIELGVQPNIFED